MFSISLFLHGCSKPQALVGSAVSQTQGVQCGTMLCMGVRFYFFSRHTRVIRHPIENTFLPLKAQARHEVTSERAPRHGAWPRSHTPRQDHCFGCAPPPGWPKGWGFGRRRRTSCLRRLILWQRCASKARSSSACTSRCCALSADCLQPFAFLAADGMGAGCRWCCPSSPGRTGGGK